MNGALEWIGQIAEWIGKFFPRWVILPVTVAAVKFVRGVPKVCEPGRIHWFWPVVTIFESYPVARQADNLPSQSIMTADEKPITIVVGGMIVYEVFDILKLLGQTWSAKHAIRDITLTAIHDVCCNLKFDELMSEQRKGTLDTKLKNAAKRQLDDFGVRPLKVQLTDLTNARVYRLIQTTSRDDDV